MLWDFWLEGGRNHKKAPGRTIHFLLRLPAFAARFGLSGLSVLRGRGRGLASWTGTIIQMCVFSFRTSAPGWSRFLSYRATLDADGLLSSSAIQRPGVGYLVELECCSDSDFDALHSFVWSKSHKRLFFMSVQAMFLDGEFLLVLFPSFVIDAFPPSVWACSLHPPPSRLQMFVPASRCCVFIALNHIPFFFFYQNSPSPHKHLQRRLPLCSLARRGGPDGRARERESEQADYGRAQKVKCHINVPTA